jgi:tetratricopeptide (TPR) repeat protein
MRGVHKMRWGGFTRAEASLPEHPADAPDNNFFANLAHGRAVAWSALGDLDRAVSFEEETVRLSPERAGDWLQLSNLYERQGRLADAQRAKERAQAIETRSSLSP